MSQNTIKAIDKHLNDSDDDAWAEQRILTV